MTPRLTPTIRSTVLLVVLEPGAPRDRLEAALTLLGIRASTLDEALGLGLVTSVVDRIDAVDTRLGRLLVQSTGDRELRIAHMALACARPRTSKAHGGREAFDRLIAALDQAARPPTAPSRRETLTPQEQHVAQLASTGAPIREIAEAAFLSQKTVEYHLTRVYRKLGVRSKAELASAFRTTDPALVLVPLAHPGH